ncbi:MAG TPA: thiamine pyrophosphate-requiring protein [Ramlibacter sp.]|nr:thiamine pyrophosphate-requiring protein [Ramlibacter sp.]
MNLPLPPDAGATVATETTAEAYLALLADRGIDCLYVGAGTDTAPVIEAYARAQSAGLRFPRPVLAAHENLAVGMAHGHTMVSRRPQAVMLHVTVGAANAVCALINAARAQVPMLFTAGRTPLYEQGPPGSRTHEVHWAQEMFDQGGMLREIVKWDYELRGGLHVEQVVDRALSVAMAEPRGPVYLTLPREVLAERVPSVRLGGAYVQPTPPHPDPEAVQRLARALLAAERPVVAATSSGADVRTVPLLAELAERFGFGVVENRPRYMGLPDAHPLHLGFEMPPVLAQADALLFLETDVPWIPAVCAPRADAFVAHAGTDPLYEAYPMRSFRSDLALTASPVGLLQALIAACEALRGQDGAAARRARLQPLAQRWRDAAAARAKADEDGGGPITKLFFSRCVDALRTPDTIVVNEYPGVREQMRLTEPGTYFQLPSSGGLGWGLPAALGAKQAAPERPVICLQGDGAYLFANPAACHHAGALHDLPVLTLVYNNQGWDAVEKAATGMHPRGHTARHAAAHGRAPLSSLAPLPAFEQYVQASGGHGECVTERGQLMPALRRAWDVVTKEQRQALVNVIGA